MDAKRRPKSFMRAAFFAAAVAAVHCRPHARDDQVALDSAKVNARSLAVELSGCAEMTSAPACVAAPGAELHLWIPGNDAKVDVTAGGAQLASRATPWPDGRTLTVVLPPGARSLEARSLGDARVAPFRIAVVAEEAPPAEVSRALSLRAEGKLDEAAALLEGSLSDASPGHASAVALLARVELARGHVELALQRLRELTALHDSDGRDSLAANDAFTAAYGLLERRRYAEVRPVLAEAERLVRTWPEGQARLEYVQGLLAWRTGDLRSALRSMRSAERRAARLEAASLHWSAAEMLGILLQDLGRVREAREVLDGVLLSDGDRMGDCERARLLSNLGFAELLLRESAPTQGDVQDPREPLGRALGIFRGSCPDPNMTADVLENVALAELEQHRLPEASAALREAKTIAREPAVSVILFWSHLDGRIALAQSDPSRALAAFTKETEFAAAFGASDDQRVAAEDRAVALVALGRGDDAIEVLESAFQLAEAGATFIPLGEGKESYFGARDRGASLHARLLLDRHRDDEAMQVARRARGRLLDGVWVSTAVSHFDDATHERWEALAGRYRATRDSIDDAAAHDWTLSSDHLEAAIARRKESASASRALLDEALALLPIAPSGDRPPHPLRHGELELLYFPTDAGWVGFSRTEDGVRAKRLGPLDVTASPAELSAKMLHPFDAAIAGAERVRLLLYGAVRAVDVHALPWHGAPLLRHAIVEYALDVAGASDAPAPASPLRALLVVDPAGDLPAARQEGDAVVSAFGSSGNWTIDGLRGADARAEPIRAALQDARLFHYAGHATFGGIDGQDSALPLAGGGRLTPGDVLALRKVPLFVSLFGCDSGRESAEGELDSLGVANAFLAAGSRTVVALSRVVDDGLARDVATAFYRQLLADPGLDAPRALREALLSVGARSGAADWAAFRALVP